jgi:hypothetical protein
MKRLVTLTMAALWVIAGGHAAAQPAPVVLRADTLLDGRGKTLKNVRVVVRDGRIQSIDADTPGGGGSAT